MKTTVVFLTALLFTLSVFAQDSETGTSEKKSRKEIRQERTEADFKRTSATLDSLQFRVMADWLGNSSGPRIPVNSTINFIQVDSSTAVIQTGNNIGIGWNGVGGTTATGRISRYKVTKNEKRKSVHVHMDVSTSIGFYTIFMDISASGNTTATLTGNRPGRLIFYGTLQPTSETFAFKGSSF